jgi:hypothetical protein
MLLSGSFVKSPGDFCAQPAAMAAINTARMSMLNTEKDFLFI